MLAYLASTQEGNSHGEADFYDVSFDVRSNFYIEFTSNVTTNYV